MWGQDEPLTDRTLHTTGKQKPHVNVDMDETTWNARLPVIFTQNHMTDART